MHLTEETYRRLLAGTCTPEEARAAALHLEASCPECEAFVAKLDGVDALDGLTDAAVAGEARHAHRGDDLEFARIRRRLGSAGDRRWKLRMPAIAAAATLAVAGVAGLVISREAPGRPGWDGLKGSAASPAPVALGFVVVSGDGEVAAFEKGRGSQEVDSSAALHFEVDAARETFLAIVRVPEAGAAHVFYRARVGPGRSPLEIQGEPAAYPLAGLSGRQRFVAFGSEGPVDEARLLRAVAALAPRPGLGAEPAEIEGLSFSIVEVVVR